MDIIRKILAPTDLSEVSATGVKYAYNLAKAISAELVIVHAVQVGEIIHAVRQLENKPSPHWEQAGTIEGQLIERHKHLLDEFVKKQVGEISPDAKVRQDVVVGQAHAAVIEHAQREKADLIVMSTHGRSGITRMMLGSVTEKVLRTSLCPVLAIPIHHSN